MATNGSETGARMFDVGARGSDDHNDGTDPGVVVMMLSLSLSLSISQDAISRSAMQNSSCDNRTRCSELLCRAHLSATTSMEQIPNASTGHSDKIRELRPSCEVSNASARAVPFMLLHEVYYAPAEHGCRLLCRRRRVFLPRIPDADAASVGVDVAGTGRSCRKYQARGVLPLVWWQTITQLSARVAIHACSAARLRSHADAVTSVCTLLSCGSLHCAHRNQMSYISVPRLRLELPCHMQLLTQILHPLWHCTSSCGAHRRTQCISGRCLYHGHR